MLEGGGEIEQPGITLENIIATMRPRNGREWFGMNVSVKLHKCFQRVGMQSRRCQKFESRR